MEIILDPAVLGFGIGKVLVQKLLSHDQMCIFP